MFRRKRQVNLFSENARTLQPLKLRPYGRVIRRDENNAYRIFLEVGLHESLVVFVQTAKVRRRQWQPVMIITRANSACRRANICSGVARICCEEEPSWRLCHGALTMDFRAGCSSCSTTNSFVTNAVLIERAVSCWHLHQLISQTIQILDSWLSDLLQKWAKMKFLKVKEGHVPHTGNAIEHQVMKWTSKCWRWDWHKQTSYSNYSYAGRSSSFHTGTVPASPARSGTHRSGSQTAWPCDSSSSRVALVTSRWEDSVQAVLADTHVASGTHAGIHLRPSDIGCQYSRSIYTTRLIVWQPRRAADTSTNWRQSLFCCLEHGTGYRLSWNCCDRRTVSSWPENISVWFCLRAPGYGLILWCALGLLVGGAIQVHQLQLQLQLQQRRVDRTLLNVYS